MLISPLNPDKIKGFIVNNFVNLSTICVSYSKVINNAKIT